MKYTSNMPPINSKRDKVELTKGGKFVNGEFRPNPPKQVSPVAPITPEQFTEEATPFRVETGFAPTSTSGEVARFESMTQSNQDAFTQNLEKQAAGAESAKHTSLMTFLNEQLGTPGETELAAEAFSREGGVDDIQFELDDINQQILAEQHSLRRKLEELDENSGGGLVKGVQIAKENATRDSLRKQADLSIIQMGIQGRYDSARQIAERAVDIQMERSKRRVEAFRTLYEDNKEQFTAAEQRAFDVAQADRERAFARRENDLKLLFETKMEAMKMAQLNGAPSQVLRAIGSANGPMEVLMAGGQYASGDMLDRMYKQAQIDNIYDTINKRAEEARKAAQEATTKEEVAQEQRKADTESALGILELATQLHSHQGFDSAVGFGLRKTLVGGLPFTEGAAISGTQRADFEALSTRLANLLTLDNLDLMSGVLSETDIKILESAGSNLGNYNQSESSYLAEIERIIDIAQRTIDQNGLTEEQAVFWGIVTDDEIGEINIIFE